MKSTLKIALISLLLVQGVTNVWAKDPSAESTEEATSKGWKFTIASVGAGENYYTPDFGYWNNVSEIRNWDTKFSAMNP